MMCFHPQSSAQDIRGVQNAICQVQIEFFIGNIDFQLSMVPLLITAKQLVLVFCKARRLAIMTKHTL